MLKNKYLKKNIFLNAIMIAIIALIFSVCVLILNVCLYIKKRNAK